MFERKKANTRYAHTAAKARKTFEGWYFKQTCGRHTVVFIPSIHIDEKGNRAAMLQIIFGDEAYCIRYEGNEFSASASQLDIRLGKNRFTAAGIDVSIATDSLSLNGSLRFGPLTALRGDIMGPFQYLPAMQCNHGVLSMRHSAEGFFAMNGKVFPFEQGIGYIEMDWGRSFPSAYAWTQCNEWPNITIMASAATVPIGPISFTGCICAVRIGDTEYRIATYHGGRVDVFTPNRMVLRQGRLLLCATCLAKQPVRLYAPASGVMARIIEESPACAVRYQLLQDGRPLLDCVGYAAGFEYAKPGQNKIAQHGRMSGGNEYGNGGA
ncbi:MAG: tocopherol cyclase family protein [Firmicutes bacterium]|nr:tocopherol cyclase family protein [Bacillota bacterium]